MSSVLKLTPAEIVDLVFPELYPECGERYMDPSSGPPAHWSCMYNIRSAYDFTILEGLDDA